MADSRNTTSHIKDRSNVTLFFESTPIPADINEVKKRVESFVSFHVTKRNKIALITSGGTTVPLEKQTVRFLDNFSTGSRGAISAEQFIAQGYAVIFLHRSSSLRPFHRHLQQSLDLLDVTPNGDVVMATSGDIKSVLLQYKQVMAANMICLVSFVSVFDFLHYMRIITPLINYQSSLVYCAAAVSDFYIHPNNMEEHKISSSSGLTLSLEQVPKLLSIICQDWSPNALVISFKLETDNDVLIDSARKALKKYGHDLVVANCLETRKTKLHIIDKEGIEAAVSLSIEEQEKGMTIEQKLVPLLCDIHAKRVT